PRSARCARRVATGRRADLSPMPTRTTRRGSMSTASTAFPAQRAPELLGQTVVVLGGSAGIGFETARRARAEGANVILTGRNPDRLERAALDVDAQSTAAFDANDSEALKRVFEDLPDPIDHVMVTGPGPDYASMLEMDA